MGAQSDFRRNGVEGSDSWSPPLLATRFAYILIYPKLSKLILFLTSQRPTKESMYRLRSSCTFAMHANHQSCRIPVSGTSISSEPMLPPRSSRSILKTAILALSSFQRNDGTGSSIYQRNWLLRTVLVCTFATFVGWICSAWRFGCADAHARYPRWLGHLRPPIHRKSFDERIFALQDCGYSGRLVILCQVLPNIDAR